MSELVLRATAKLNLVLRVGPLADDGYHPIETLMVALAEPFDSVRVQRADTRSVTCAEAPGVENLAWAALDALEQACGRSLPLAVEIDKGIPAQAGLGGGSSDAAAVLEAANRLHDCGLNADDLERVAAEVGSDVPFFVRGGIQWARGRGEQLEPTTRSGDLHVVIVDGGIRLSTAEVYTAFDRVGGDPAGDNDLWPAARRLAPQLDELAEEIMALGAERTLLCGSGGALAGIFDSRPAAAQAAAALSSEARCWATAPCQRLG